MDSYETVRPKPFLHVRERCPVAAAIVTAGLIISSYIRCPRCGTRWYWMAIKTASYGWYKALKARFGLAIVRKSCCNRAGHWVRRDCGYGYDFIANV
jgi:DNA-directed RNA polymerase subunit RPC12/RpoP